MKTRLILLVSLLALCAVLVAVCPQAETTVTVDRDEEIVYPSNYMGENDFTFKDELETKHRLSDYAGRPVAVVFWASWSRISENQLEILDKIYSSYTEESECVILPIDMGKNGKDSLKKASSVYYASEHTFPLYIDKSGVTKYNVTSAPQTLFFTADGELYSHYTGVITADVFESEFAAMLRGE